jgi:hypothetical protein
MESNSNSLREHYSSLTDDELKYIAITGGLTTAAREVLEQELHHRGISDVNEYEEHLQHAEQKRLEKKDKDRKTHANSATRILRGCAAFAANFLAAITGVGLLKNLSSLLVKLFTHSTASIVLTQWVASIFFAALLGDSVQRRWKTRTARWIWIPALLMFLFGLFSGHGYRPGNRWLAFSGVACAQPAGAWCVPFLIFTVPLVRAVTYSLAAFLSSRFSAQRSAEFHPLLSKLLSGLFLVGLPKSKVEQSPKEQAVTNPDTLE